MLRKSCGHALHLSLLLIQRYARTSTLFAFAFTFLCWRVAALRFARAEWVLAASLRKRCISASVAAPAASRLSLRAACAAGPCLGLHLVEHSVLRLW